MDFSSPVLTLEINDHIATLWLDRPEKRNAMSRELVADLPRAMAAIAANEDVRAVVIAGRGKSFCVGIDLASLGGGSSEGEGGKEASGATASLRQIKVTRDFQASISSVAECPVPVIAAIHSHCIGAGMDLVTACDIRLAAEDALFGVRGTKFILQQGEDLTTEQSLLLNGLWTMVTTLNSNDLGEAMQAMMEKRPPHFSGS